MKDDATSLLSGVQNELKIRYDALMESIHVSRYATPPASEWAMPEAPARRAVSTTCAYQILTRWVRLYPLMTLAQALQETALRLFPVIEQPGGERQVIVYAPGEQLLAMALQEDSWQNQQGLYDTSAGGLDEALPTVFNPHANVMLKYLARLQDRLRHDPWPPNTPRVLDASAPSVAQAFLANQVVEEIRAEFADPSFKRALNQQRQHIGKNQKGLTDYIDYLLASYEMLQVMRIQLGCSVSLEQPVSYLTAKAYRTAFFAPDSACMALGCRGYVCKLEYGSAVGFSYHVMLFFAMQSTVSDRSVTRALERDWVEVITQGAGWYFDYADYPAEPGPMAAATSVYKTAGIGWVSADDKESKTAMERAIVYFALADELARLQPPDHDRLLFRGIIPKGGSDHRKPSPAKVTPAKLRAKTTLQVVVQPYKKTRPEDFGIMRWPDHFEPFAPQFQELASCTANTLIDLSKRDELRQLFLHRARFNAWHNPFFRAILNSVQALFDYFNGFTAYPAQKRLLDAVRNGIEHRFIAHAKENLYTYANTPEGFIINRRLAHMDALHDVLMKAINVHHNKIHGEYLSGLPWPLSWSLRSDLKLEAMPEEILVFGYVIRKPVCSLDDRLLSADYLFNECAKGSLLESIMSPGYRSPETQVIVEEDACHPDGLHLQPVSVMGSSSPSNLDLNGFLTDSGLGHETPGKLNNTPMADGLSDTPPEVDGLP